MNNLLSVTAVLSAFTWSIGYFLYQEGRFIHIFLGVALVAGVIRILRSGMIVIK